MPRSLFTALFLLCAAVFGTLTTAGSAGAQPLQDLLQENRSDIERPSRQTIGPVITEIARSGLPGVQQFFEAWSERELYQDEETGLFHLVETDDGETYRLLDLSTGEVVAEKNEDALDQLRPNAGVRGLIGSALVPAV